jgi:cytochrome c biogenesis protein CcmG/thiol:disulfide interchange protein DsbE
MRRLFFLLPLVGALALIGWLGYPILVGHNPQVLPSALLDKPVPAFDLPSLNEDEASMASTELATGGPVLLNVFASWCAPCRAEIPLMRRLVDEGAITVFGLAYKDDPKATRDFLETLGNPYKRIAVDRDGRVGIDFGVYGVPETYVIDGDGRIRYRHVGELTRSVVEEQLIPLMREIAG